MRRSNNDNFFLAYLLNLLLNFEWSIPAWVLLVLHFLLDVPLFLFWIALGVWIGGVFIMMLLLNLIRKSVPDSVPSENKNPYSKTTASFLRSDKTNGDK